MVATEIESLDDIIFQERNKAYGAYQLRKNQDRNSLMAMIIVCGILAGFVGAHFIVSFFTKKIIPFVETPEPGGEYTFEEYTEYNIPVSGKNNLTKTTTSSKAGTAYTIVEKTNNTLPIEDKTDYHNGPSIEGTESAGTETGSTEGSTQTNGTGFFEENNFQPLIQIDEAAVFPGGEKMFEKYIKDNYKFPEEAIKENLSGILFVYFEVDEYGKIKNVKITHSFPGAGNFEAEAIRVISNMPDWSPRKINGKSTRTRRELQINCKL